MIYKRDKITDTETLKTLRLSPSSINTFFQCPRKWYNQYILALPTVNSLAMSRGSAVHGVLEDIMKQRFVPSGEAFRPHMEKMSMKLFNSKWNEYCLEFKDSPEYETSRDECIFMVERFIKRFCDNIQMGIKINKFTNETQGYYFTRPIFKELWIDDQLQIKLTEKNKPVFQKNEDKEPILDTLNVGGFIDNVQKNFENQIILVDYKTSNKYKNSLSLDYTRQLAIYAYLWYKQFKEIPTYVCINYLKFDESYYILVNHDLIQMAITDIKHVRNCIVEWGLDKSKYFKNEGKLCEYCSDYSNCVKTSEEVKQ